MKDKGQIIVIRRKRKGHAAHHGGAWKVAYADFVTAMMAFFLVMWLMAQKQEVKASIGRAPDQEYMIPGEAGTQSDFAGQFKAMRRLGYRGYLVPEMSVHVMRRPNYDPYGALRLATESLGALLRGPAGEEP